MVRIQDPSGQNLTSVKWLTVNASTGEVTINEYTGVLGMWTMYFGVSNDFTYFKDMNTKPSLQVNFTVINLVSSPPTFGRELAPIEVTPTSDVVKFEFPAVKDPDGLEVLPIAIVDIDKYKFLKLSVDGNKTLLTIDPSQVPAAQWNTITVLKVRLENIKGFKQQVFLGVFLKAEASGGSTGNSSKSASENGDTSAKNITN